MKNTLQTQIDRQIVLLEHKVPLAQMRKFLQHGTTNTYVHSRNVAHMSGKIARLLPLSINLKSMTTGAMLHDFYMYDWHHVGSERPYHGYRHPETAYQNSRRYLTLDPISADIIRKHMWPLTLTKVPRYRESLIVCLADKICSVMETLKPRARV